MSNNRNHITHAITRKPGENFANGITTANLGEPIYELILEQHAAYVQTLRSLGIQVTILNPLADHPDAYFVEDTAVVTPDIAVVTIPGAKTRQGEEDTIESELNKYRNTVRIKSPGTVDGGDVLMVGSHFFIGISERTNTEGAKQLGRILEDFGNTWAPIPVGAGLHLKSSVNYIGRNTLLVTNGFVPLTLFKGYSKIVVDVSEAYAANTLFINNTLIMPAGFPKTKKQLEALDHDIIELNISEVRKMDGGLTCMSLRFLVGMQHKR